MKPRLMFWTLGLVIALLAIACAPSNPTETAPPVVEATATVASAPLVETAVPQVEATIPAVLPVATSRGPNLEATDPATVSFASGGLQLIEFFRFT
ncbi:MAG TPA: hypothetical protein PKE23_05195 [Anaerolineales bacterium]|nr:hypothetical protein [Anaerolineales bacterium]HNB41513.1 hypothetical protein [Anaerolineales bacterium]HND48468.1 hypothetical protein [Anaerolineales bacterium]HNF93879.1 hypothetical protein [Anaerolineales bacterium]HNM36799.1 hypothetical protein [Anaerolineales bacterium]